MVTDTQDYNPQSISPDTGNLRYPLTNACAGSTLNLSQLTGVISLQSRLRIDGNMTVIGLSANSLAIDGGNKTRLFFIGNGRLLFSTLLCKTDWPRATAVRLAAVAAAWAEPSSCKAAQ